MQDSENFRKYTLFITCSASFVTPFIGNAIYLAIPDIGIAYQASTLLLSWVLVSYLLASAVFLLPFGRLADIIGYKKLFILGHLLSFISSFLGAYAWSIQWLIIFRVIHGISAALVFSTAMAILTSVFPPEARGKALGINAATVYLGLSFSPVVGGFLTYKWGWASIFILSGILWLTIFLLTLTKLKGEWVGSPDDSFDWKGSTLYIIGLSAFLYGLSSLHWHWTSWLSILAGLLFLVIFIRHELRIDSPLLPLQLLKENRTFTYFNLAALINYAATFAIILLLSLYLQSLLHLDSKTTGLILLSQPIIMTAVSPFAGYLSDRMDAKKISSWGMIICMMSLFFFSFINLNTPAYLIVANLILSGIGFGLFASPNNNVIMSSVEKRFYGMASSTLASMRLIGMSISMALATLILDNYVGNVQLSAASPDQLLTGIRTAFAIFTLVCLSGVIATWQKEKPLKEKS